MSSSVAYKPIPPHTMLRNNFDPFLRTTRMFTDHSDVHLRDIVDGLNQELRDQVPVLAALHPPVRPVHDPVFWSDDPRIVTVVFYGDPIGWLYGAATFFPTLVFSDPWDNDNFSKAAMVIPAVLADALAAAALFTTMTVTQLPLSDFLNGFCPRNETELGPVQELLDVVLRLWGSQRPSRFDFEPLHVVAVIHELAEVEQRERVFPVVETLLGTMPEGTPARELATAAVAASN